MLLQSLLKWMLQMSRSTQWNKKLQQVRKESEEGCFPFWHFSVSNLKMWLQSFSELLFSLQQSSKNLVSFDFSPLAEKWHIWGQGMKAWSLGRRGKAIAFQPTNSCRCKKCAHEKGGLVEAPFLNGGLLSSINLFALPFVSRVLPPTLKRTSHSSMWPPEGLIVFVVKFSVIT